MRWRAAAHGSSWRSLFPARWVLFMASCKARGPLEWSRPSGRSWPCAAGISRESDFPSELIQPVERRYLISLGERRIVEHSVAKIFDGRSHRQHGLSNVYDLGRAVANDVDTQQFQRIRIKENL